MTSANECIVKHKIKALSLLYLSFVIMFPSPALAKAGDGTVFDV